MKRYIPALFIATLLPGVGMSDNSGSTQVKPKALWREAVALYTMETDDYLSTVTDSLKEIKFWREMILKEKFEARTDEVEKVLAKGNAESLDEIETYVIKSGVDRLDDTMLMRIAQLHYEKAGFELSRDMKKYQKETELYQQGRESTAPEFPTPDYTKAEFYAGELLRKFPDSPLADSANYLLAYCLFDEGNGEKATASYEQLIRSHPYSPLVPEVKWRLAEDYFDSGKFESALGLYQSLSETKTKFSMGALYKEGAILFSTGQYTQAAPLFLKLYEESALTLDSTDPQTQTLYDESVDYLARLKGKGIGFVMDEDTDAIITQQLSEIYRRSELRALERQAYLSFVASHPLSKSAPRFMDRVIDSYVSDGQLGKAQEVRNKFITALSPTSSFWVKYKKDIGATVEAQDLYEKHLIASADFYGEQAKYTKRQKDYNAAVDLFRKFLSEYSYSPFFGEASFDLAELFYAFGDFKNASGSYFLALKKADNETYKEDAAYGYLVSQTKAFHFSLKDDFRLKPDRKKDGSLTSPSKPSKEEVGFLEAALVYVKSSSLESRRQRVLYRVAEIYFRHNRFAQVREALDLLNSTGTTTLVTSAASRLWAATYDLENNLTLTLAGRQDLTLVTELDQEQESVVEYTTLNTDRSELIEASTMLKEGQIGEAATDFENFYRKYPKSNEAPHVLFRAGVLFRRAGAIEASQKAFSQFIKEFPKDPRHDEAEFLEIGNEVSILKFDEAIEGYENFAKTHPQISLAQQAHLNAAYLNKAMGHLKEAAIEYEQFALRTRDDEALFRVIQLYRIAGDPKSAARSLSRFLNPIVGRDFYIRGLFEQAALDASHSERNCQILEAAEKRYQLTLSAQSRHAINGCAYLKTWALRNDLIHSVKSFETFKDKFANLVKLGHVIEETHDQLWLAYFNLDLASVLAQASKELLNSKPDQAAEWKTQSMDFDYTAFRLFGASQFIELPSDTIRRIKHSLTMVIGSPEVVWPTSMLTPELISLDPSTSEAHTFGEQGLWSKARTSLMSCVNKNILCSASLLNLGYDGPKIKEWEASLTQEEANPFARLALARSEARQGRALESLALIRKVLKEDSKNPMAYGLAAQIYENQGQSDLAHVTLTQGLENTDEDENLVVQNGYLNLFTGREQAVKTLITEAEGTGNMSVPLQVFIAHAYQSMGKAREAVGVLDGRPANPELLCARFAIGLLQKDSSALSRLKPRMEAAAQEHPYAGYLLGLYHQTEKSGRHPAEKESEP